MPYDSRLNPSSDKLHCTYGVMHYPTLYIHVHMDIHMHMQCQMYVYIYTFMYVAVQRQLYQAAWQESTFRTVTLIQPKSNTPLYPQCTVNILWRDFHRCAKWIPGNL